MNLEQVRQIVKEKYSKAATFPWLVSIRYDGLAVIVTCPSEIGLLSDEFPDWADDVETFMAPLEADNWEEGWAIFTVWEDGYAAYDYDKMEE